ncbi:hypothetical protein BY458DRAFT_497096 [Sporodiniella umbellata]|nr:hypothetical protein BY458DRAFT_497096 [Sporodiniella umbellata]
MEMIEEKLMLEISQTIPIYLIIPIALVKSQMYWLCSVLCCAFKTQNVEPKPVRPVNRIRTRAKSNPTIIKSIEKPEKTLQRRSSDSNYIRSRPSIQDELTGTTCPPVWWQKTKSKLRHSQAHSTNTKKTEALELPQITLNDSRSSTESRSSKKRNIFKLQYFAFGNRNPGK